MLQYKYFSYTFNITYVNLNYKSKFSIDYKQSRIIIKYL